MSQTAGRVLHLFEAVIRSDQPHGLMELAELTDIDKSTAARLLGLLVDRGLLSRNVQTRRYEIGPEFVSMLMTFTSRLDVRRVAAPHLVELRDASGETVSLHLKVDKSRICIDGLESDHPIRRVAPLGESIPLYEGPSGKVILAHLDEIEAKSVLASAAKAGVDCDALQEQLGVIRTAGMVLTDGDRTPGIRAASVCIFGPQGAMGSITIAGPSSRWSDSAARDLTDRLRAAARAVSSTMGGVSA